MCISGNIHFSIAEKKIEKREILSEQQSDWRPTNNFKLLIVDMNQVLVSRGMNVEAAAAAAVNHSQSQQKRLCRDAKYCFKVQPTL